jgi:isoquinoline 1-oxidoreductase beta subunit
MTTKHLGRREFLKTGAVASAGLLVGFRFASAQDGADIAAAPADFAPNGYLRVGSDGSITIFADHVELGQGSGTALPMIVAEELDADWTKLRVERMPDDPSAWPRKNIMTVGSQAVRTSYAPLRTAGATAREMLAQAGAQSWKVDRAEVRTEKGFVIHTASGRRASYGALADAAGKIAPPANPPLKDPKDFKIVGTRVHRVDIPSKINGSAQFGIDVRLPGMLYATVVRSPVIGGKVRSFDAAEAKAVAGVKDVVQFQNGVAVLATDTWTALKARKLLKIEWDDAANAGLSSAVPGRVARRCDGGVTGGAKRHHGGLRIAIRRARDDGTDELHGARARRWRGRVGADAGAVEIADGGGESRGRAGERGETARDDGGRRLWAALTH